MAVTERAAGWATDGVAAITLASLTFHPLCDLVFRCGCAWFFAGAADHCDIRDPAPPNCPPCAYFAAVIAFGLAIAGMWLAAARGMRAGLRSTG